MKYIVLWVLLVVVSVLIILFAILNDANKFKILSKNKSNYKKYKEKLNKLNIDVLDFKYNYRFKENIKLDFKYNDKLYSCKVINKEIYINNYFIKSKYVDSPFDKLYEIIELICQNETIYNYKKEVVNL